MVQATPHLGDLSHRTRRRMDLSQGAYDGIDEARTYFYSANWQVLEEHVDTDLDDDTDRIGQQFWGVRYIDDAVARRVDRDGDGTFSGDPDDNFFYLTDVMFGVRALVDGEGRLHTRLDYTPYGVAMHGKAADVNGDGALNFTDITAFNAVYNGGTALRPGEAGYDPDADLSGSGSMNFFDYTAFTSRFSDYSSGPSFNDGWIDNPNDDVNGPDNSVGYDGYWFDLAGATEATSTGLYTVRHRVYDPKLGRWLQRDPMGYIDGAQIYSFSRHIPTRRIDPYGLCSVDTGCQGRIDSIVNNNDFVRTTLKYIKEMGCAAPTIKCGDCEDHHGGTFNPTTNTIVVCEGVEPFIPHLIDRVLRHELIHAADHCSGADLFQCEQRACSEIRAYFLGGQCNEGAEWRGTLGGGPADESQMDCVKRNAKSSVKGACDPSAVDRVFTRCLSTIIPPLPGRQRLF